MVRWTPIVTRVTRLTMMAPIRALRTSRGWVTLSARRSALLSLGVALLALCAFTPAPAFASVEERIVVLQDNANPDKVAQDLRLTPKLVYRYALRGFAADMSNAQAAQAEADNR